MALGYIIELLDNRRHDSEDFNCGIEELDNYLRERASQETRKKVTAVYILRKNSSLSVIGYFTLSACSVELNNLPEELTRKLPKYKVLPGILIGRLAVSRQFQGKKLGEYLLLDALSRSYKLSRQIGSFAVLVDAKDEKSGKFYQKYGFKKSIKYPLKLYLPMGTIKMIFDQ